MEILPISKLQLIYFYTELSFEVYNSFLGQLAQKWGVIKVQRLKQKCLEKVHFTSLKDYNLTFLLILDLQLLDFQLKHQHGCALTAASPKNGGKIQIISHETSKMHLLQASLFWTWNFDESPILGLLTQEEVIYLKKKALCSSK